MFDHRQEGRTGASFAQTLAYIFTRKPSSIVLENVPGLHQAPKNGGPSDAEWVVEQLREHKLPCRMDDEQGLLTPPVVRFPITGSSSPVCVPSIQD